MHLKEDSCEEWFILSTVPVKHLSSQPDIEKSVVQGLLRQLKGSFGVRVLARNVSGIGEAAQLAVCLEGEH